VPSHNANKHDVSDIVEEVGPRTFLGLPGEVSAKCRSLTLGRNWHLTQLRRAVDDTIYSCLVDDYALDFSFARHRLLDPV
jgi:hypothetical protein